MKKIIITGQTQEYHPQVFLLPQLYPDCPERTETPNTAEDNKIQKGDAARGHLLFLTTHFNNNTEMIKPVVL